MPGLARIPVDGVELEGMLEVPEGASGVVLFAHGTGSSRHSPRNNAVAAALRESGRFGTLLFDLLTADEDVTYRTRFDIDLLTERLLAATRWVRDRPETGGSSLGFFGASTGAAGALRAAAALGDEVGAVVSRGGRPDLAGEALGDVGAPTLLIVGGRDTPVIEMNREAASRLRAEHEIVIVPGATHLFEEPGALEQVSDLAADWFERHLI